MILGIELPVEFQQMFVDGSLNEQEFETAVNYDTENELANLRMMMILW